MNDDEITFAKAATYLPMRNGKRVHIQSLIRWATKGCRGKFLNAWKVGGIWYTTVVDLEQFKIDCTPKRKARAKSAGGMSVRSAAERARAIAKARERLRKNGFYDSRDPVPGRPKGRRVPGGQDTQ